MRKPIRRILTICLLLLTLALTAAACAETLDVSCDYPSFSRKYYLGLEFAGDSIEPGRVLSDAHLAFFTLNDTEGLEGRPQWDFVQTQGTASFTTWSSNEINRELRLIRLPVNPEKNVFHITCEWGERTWSADFTVEFVRYSGGLPTGIETDLEDGLTVKAGEAIDLTGHAWFREDWGIAGEPRRVTLNQARKSEYDYMPESDHYNDWKMADGSYRVSKPGVYSAYVTVGSGNVAWREPFILYVIDADGVLPTAPVMTVEAITPEITVYLGLGLRGYDSSVSSGWQIWADSPVLRICVPNCTQLYEYYRYYPQMQVTVKADEEIAYRTSYSLSSDQMTYYVTPQNMPSTSMTAEFEITLQCVDQQQTVTIPVHYVNAPNGLPTGHDYPALVTDLKVGDRLVIEPHAQPAGWTLPGEETELLLPDRVIESFAERDDAASNAQHAEYVITEAGTFSSNIMVKADGIHIGQQTVFVIAEADGTEKPESMQIFSEYDQERNFYIGVPYAPDTTPMYQAYSQGKINRLAFQNRQLVEAQAGSAAVWKAVPAEGTSPTARVSMRPDDEGAVLYLEAMPLQEEADTYLITCNCGTSHWETEFTIYFKDLPNGLPTGLQVRSNDHPIVVREGVPGYLDMRFDFKNDWRIDDEYVRVEVVGDAVDKMTRGVCPPGTYEVTVTCICANVCWSEPFTICAARKDGTLPAADYPYLQENVAVLPRQLKSIGEDGFAGTQIRLLDLPEGVTDLADRLSDQQLTLYSHSQYVTDYGMYYYLNVITD